MLLFTAQTSADFSLNRLLLLENIFDLGHQTVRDAMVPWTRVQSLSRSATREAVLRLLTEHRFSRWPVLDHTEYRISHVTTSAVTNLFCKKLFLGHKAYLSLNAGTGKYRVMIA